MENKTREHRVTAAEGSLLQFTIAAARSAVHLYFRPLVMSLHGTRSLIQRHPPSTPEEAPENKGTEYAIRRIGSIAVVDLIGVVTTGAGDFVLRAAVSQLLDQGVRTILINLTAVKYVDSGVIGELVASSRRAKTRGSTITLVIAPGNVSDVVTAIPMQVHGMFQTYIDEESALESIFTLPGARRHSYQAERRRWPDMFDYTQEDDPC